MVVTVIQSELCHLPLLMSILNDRCTCLMKKHPIIICMLHRHNPYPHRHKPPSSQAQVFVATDTSLCQTEHLCLSRPIQDGTK